jgi:hypothetical protein
MKGKLIKLNVGVGYRLDDEHGDLFASTLQSSKTKLSIQNCDKIFGAFEVEKLINESDTSHLSQYTSDSHELMFDEGFKIGFNKAMELNKDKLFTIKDIRRAMSAGLSIGYGRQFEIEDKQFEIDAYTQELQQPKEIEVEVVMDKIPADLAPGGWDVFPKLDSQGCLILKKVL